MAKNWMVVFPQKAAFKCTFAMNVEIANQVVIFLQIADCLLLAVSFFVMIIDVLRNAVKERDKIKG
jgi:hypothetical protein